jgi:hypothetical protein
MTRVIKWTYPLWGRSLRSVSVRSSIVAAHTPGVRPQRGPTARGAAGKQRDRSGGRGPTVLTDLLTTALDYPGHVRNEQPREQGRCDRLDSRGRL